MRECDLEAYLARRVRACGGEIRKVSFPGHLGAPDRVVFFPNGKLFWIELKTLRGIVRPEQSREHYRLCKLGQLVFVLRTKEGVEDFLDRWKHGSL